MLINVLVWWRSIKLSASSMLIFLSHFASKAESCSTVCMCVRVFCFIAPGYHIFPSLKQHPDSSSPSAGHWYYSQTCRILFLEQNPMPKWLSFFGSIVYKSVVDDYSSAWPKSSRTVDRLPDILFCSTLAFVLTVILCLSLFISASTSLLYQQNLVDLTWTWLAGRHSQCRFFTPSARGSGHIKGWQCWLRFLKVRFECLWVKWRWRWPFCGA